MVYINNTLHSRRSWLSTHSCEEEWEKSKRERERYKSENNNYCTIITEEATNLTSKLRIHSKL